HTHTHTQSQQLPQRSLSLYPLLLFLFLSFSPSHPLLSQPGTLFRHQTASTAVGFGIRAACTCIPYPSHPSQALCAVFLNTIHTHSLTHACTQTNTNTKTHTRMHSSF